MRVIEWKTCWRICASAFLLFLAINYWNGLISTAALLIQAGLPLIVGGAVAYIVNILMSFYERKIRIRGKAWPKVRRPLCMILALLTVLLGAFCLVQLIIPQLISAFQVLLEALPETLESLYRWMDETFRISSMFTGENSVIPQTQQQWTDLIKRAANVLYEGVGGAMSVVISAATSVLGGAVTAFVSLIFAIYILLGKERLASQFLRLAKRVLGEKNSARMCHVIGVLDDSFHSYIVGQCLEALILGGLCALGMIVLRLPYAVMIGALVGVTALIPIAGAYIGAAIGAVMIFSVEPVKAIIFLVFLVILQQVEGNLIYPRTVGSSLGLPGFWVLAAVTLGGGVMGVAGMILFVPLTAAAYRLVGQYVRKGEKAA